MLATYFIHIAAVRMAAALTGRTLYDNYAFHGALERFSSLDIGVIHDADGIEDTPVKAESFKFGQACGKALSAAIKDYDDIKKALCEAAIAKNVFLKLSPESCSKYSEAEQRDAIMVILRALLKHGQIQTHTAKPGYEDINAWLADYNRLSSGYEPTLSAFADWIVKPDEAQEKIMSGFFSKEDPIIAMALACQAQVAGAPDSALSATPVCEFGHILKTILTSP
jgi:hypothetical protein